jgi:hypothetical protein
LHSDRRRDSYRRVTDRASIGACVEDGPAGYAFRHAANME